MDPRTRFVELDANQDRRRAGNRTTQPPLDSFTGLKPQDYATLFELNYETMRDKCREIDSQGVICFAMDVTNGKLAGSMWVKAKPHVINTGVIGRHARCELFLDRDRTVSLRHCLLLVRPTGDGDKVTFRLIDLRTSLAFMDEYGRRLEAIEAEGPVFLCCGRYALFFFVTGNPEAWPEDCDSAWERIPDRMYLDEKTAVHRSSQGDSESRPATSEDLEPSTCVTIMHGPQRPRNMVDGSGETPLGVLTVRTQSDSQDIIIGEAAAQQGILLGCYDRCDDDCLALLRDRNISRVHVLILAIDDHLYVVDTASTNGTYVEGQRFRIARLSSKYEVALGHRRAFLRWKGAA